MAQNEYDYIDERFHTPGTIGTGRYLNRQTAGNDSSSKLHDCLKKYKIITAVIVSVLLISGIVATVLALFLPAKSKTDGGPGGNSENGPPKTTPRPICKPPTSQTESNSTGPALLVIMGGNTDNGTFSDKVQIYSVNEGHVTWKGEGRPAPYPWSGAGTVASGGDIYIVGGITGHHDPEAVAPDSAKRRAARYNVRENIWEILPNKTKTASFRPAMYVINNQLYVADGDGLISYVPIFPIPTEKLDLCNIDATWTKEEATPTHQVLWTDAVVLGTKVYICAGTWAERIKTVISWSYGEPKWTSVKDMNIARVLHGTVTDGGSSIWVIGGCAPNDCWPDGFIEQYSVANNTWTKLNQVPNIERDNYTVRLCSFWQGYIYVIFSKTDRLVHTTPGTGLIPTFHVFNTETGKWHEDSTELMLPVYDSMFAIVPGSL